MTLRLALFLSATLLAACGADGPPQPPAAEPGITVTGEASIGVASE